VTSEIRRQKRRKTAAVIYIINKTFGVHSDSERRSVKVDPIKNIELCNKDGVALPVFCFTEATTIILQTYMLSNERTQ